MYGPVVDEEPAVVADSVDEFSVGVTSYVEVAPPVPDCSMVADSAAVDVCTGPAVTDDDTVGWVVLAGAPPVDATVLSPPSEVEPSEKIVDEKLGVAWTTVEGTPPLEPTLVLAALTSLELDEGTVGRIEVDCSPPVEPALELADIDAVGWMVVEGNEPVAALIGPASTDELVWLDDDNDNDDEDAVGRMTLDGMVPVEPSYALDDVDTVG